MLNSSLKMSMLWLLIIAINLGMNGCATLAPKVPMAPPELDAEMKTFPPPSEGKAGLYIYRDSMFGAAIMDDISLDDVVTGKLAVNTFMYRELTPGPHVLSVPTEFANYKLDFNAESGQNHFIHYYIRMGVFKGNGAFEIAERGKAKASILKLNLAQ